MSDKAVNLFDRSVALLALAESIRDARVIARQLADELCDPGQTDSVRAAVFMLIARSTAGLADELAAELRSASGIAWMHTIESELAELTGSVNQ